MTEFLSPIITTIVEQADAQSVPEIVAVVAAVLYLVFAIRQHIICWLFAAVSTSVYVGLFVVADLYMEAVLNAFYLVMAVYGFVVWRNGGMDRKLPVVRWRPGVHALAIVALTSGALLNGALLSAYTDAAFPYIDSATTWFAIWATFLVARKVLENWWYWLAIDLVSIVIYWQRDLQLTSVLFAVYVMMIPIGMLSWRRSMKSEQPAS